MYKLDIDKKGLLHAAELEKGVDLIAGYTETVNGEFPPLTEPQKEEILTAHRIHCGKVSRCSICGHPLPDVKGCFACSNCGSNVGNCG